MKTIKDIINENNLRIGSIDWNSFDCPKGCDIMCIMIGNQHIDFFSSKDDEYLDEIDEDIQKQILSLKSKGESCYDKKYDNFYLKIK